MKFTVAFNTHVGMKRTQNQDSLGVYPELGLFIVADGMGGHLGGETASAMAVETITERVKKLLMKPQEPWTPPGLIKHAIFEANFVIFEKSTQDPKLRGMGTTTTALLFQHQQLAIGHVGDSRCYFFRPQMFWQVTRDHSLVQEKCRAGLMTRQEAKTHTMKNVLTRSVGFETELEIDIYQMHAQPGDCFLICSDGLCGLVEDRELFTIIENCFFNQSQTQADLQETVNALVRKANSNGGDDNITCILLQVLETTPPRSPE